MRLIRRGTITQLLQSDIDQHIQECVRNGFGDASPQDLDWLRISTRAWIKEKTAYAIFSHRWLDQGEFTYEDTSNFAQLSPGGSLELNNESDLTICGGTGILNQVNSLITNKAHESPGGSMDLTRQMEKLCRHSLPQGQQGCQGFVKLIQFCRISWSYKCNYVWFDTGCINKSSSAELEESIRSMFNWYQNSHICIVHLAETRDVRSLREDPWFTRGWTLQELLAPQRVKFYSKSWQPIIMNTLDNDKDPQHRLWGHISDITGIARERIFDFKPGIHNARDAFVWLSKRQTTRIEDMAYCLIGLLDIPFLIAYGEGGKAFYRLQVEILQQTSDMGLFIWEGQPATDNSMLAAGPQCFSSLPSQPLYNQPPTDESDQSWSFTSHGLRIPLSIRLIESSSGYVGDGVSGDMKITLGETTEELRGVAGRLRTQEGYESIELAVLGRVEGQSSGEQKSFAILLGSKNRQRKRVAMGHIIYSHPIDTTWQMRFIR